MGFKVVNVYCGLNGMNLCKIEPKLEGLCVFSHECHFEGHEEDDTCCVGK